MSDVILRDGERLDDLLIDDRKIIQNPSYYMLTSDAILLARFAKVRKGEKVCDLGSGSGIIPLHMALTYEVGDYTGIEIQECMADMASRSIILNSLEDRVRVLCRDMRGYGAECRESYDVVTSNPPYMKANSGKRNEFDEKFIARHEVCGDISDFCACAYRLLKHGGKFYCVYRPDRLTDLLTAMRENRLEPKVITFVAATADSEPSMVLVRAIKGGASGNTVTRTLFLHSSREDSAKSILSPDAKAIYENCSFENFFNRSIAIYR